MARTTEDPSIWGEGGERSWQLDEEKKRAQRGAGPAHQPPLMHFGAGAWAGKCYCYPLTVFLRRSLMGFGSAVSCEIALFRNICSDSFCW
ncbi:hypothetical protein AVEN_221451-1 [Araneus ventricosus]|uniref:Uncharacterized protein n=1 Tax=Araneus ventricosus TaxID=182803 RepID=A0A4Y2V7I2_ARAVE|nr:hypothetical protein AVEN_221451-1 [Araneus ventricosus]